MTTTKAAPKKKAPRKKTLPKTPEQKKADSAKRADRRKAKKDRETEGTKAPFPPMPKVINTTPPPALSGLLTDDEILAKAEEVKKKRAEDFAIEQAKIIKGSPTPRRKRQRVKRKAYHCGVLDGAPFEAATLCMVEFVLRHKIFKNQRDKEEDGLWCYGKKVMLSDAQLEKVKDYISEYRVRWVGKLDADKDGNNVGIGPNKTAANGKWFTHEAGANFYGLENDDEPLAKYVYIQHGRPDFINPPTTSLYDSDEERFNCKMQDRIEYDDEDYEDEDEFIGGVSADDVPEEWPAISV